MPLPLVGAAIGVLGSIVGGIMGSKSAKSAAASAERERARLQRQMSLFEENRQEVINPYSGVSSLSGMIDEMREGLSNPFANLGVATSAAEIQMEQTDIALANTLDTLQATGASAGGATALAQAAKQSKKEVAANIEQQEAANEKMAAQGEQNLQAKEMQLTQMEMSEEARIQNAEAAGKQFMFGAQENRDMATLDRMQGGIDQANVNAANANMAGAQSMAGMISGVTGVIGAGLSSGAFDPSGTGTNTETIIPVTPPVTPAGGNTSSTNVFGDIANRPY
tara:strand:+ start:212 stop:1051 length:840 start_codon:yes stop_codon:yes gene_type:complete